jgi:hypothetical protein
MPVPEKNKNSARKILAESVRRITVEDGRSSHCDRIPGGADFVDVF